MVKKIKMDSKEDVKPVVQKNFIQKVWSWLTFSKKRWIGALVVILLAVFGIWKLQSNAASAVTYQTGVVTKGTVVSTISDSGRALTTSALNIETQVSGIVKDVYVKDGDTVYTGERIADVTFDTNGQQNYAQAYASYLSAKNAVASDNANYYSLQSSMFTANQKFINDAVMRGLATDDPTYIEENGTWQAAQASFLEQQTSLAKDQSSLNNAAINLQQNASTITSPYTGTISNITLVPGMVLSNTVNNSSTSSSSTSSSSTTRIATIDNQSTPIINVTLSETDVPNIKVGQKATITFDSITGETFTGVVATVDRIGAVSSNVTSYTANIKLDSGSDQILPNMAATADIIIDTATDALYVPSAALITQNGTTYAKTLVNGKEVDVAVETGISDDTNTVITSGLSEGTTVITGTTSKSATTTSTGTSVFSSSLRGFGGATGGGGGAVIRTSGGGGGATRATGG